MTTLRELAVLLLDGQATGASPEHGHLVEVGWAATRAAIDPIQNEVTVSRRLVRLPEDAKLPWRVAELTGLRSRDLRTAPPEDEVWADLAAAARAIAADGTVAPTVVHCARFEQSFLRALHARVAPEIIFPLRPVCTLEIARRLLPDIPRRGLRALAGYFGHATGQLRRAEGHVRATAVVWHHLVAHLALRGIHDLDGLEAFLDSPPPRRSVRRVYPMPKETRLSLPDTPGVYRMLRTSGDVLYVGKAVSLRRRVNSYFQKQSDRSERMLELLSQARNVDFTPAATSLEAALLESDEIKTYDPPYNVALRATGRSAWFAAHGLRDLAPSASRRHRLGPLGSPWWIQRLWGLWGVLESPPPGEDARTALAAALGPTIRGVPDEVVRAGFAAFYHRFPLRARDPQQVLALGTARWREGLEEKPAADPEPDAEDAPEPEPEPDAEDAPEWDADAVRDGLEDIVVAVAHALRRAGWLRVLSESTVAWREDARWHGLVVERGTVVRRLDARHAADLPSPRGANRSMRSRRWSFDLATFDRMRVLTTELRRIVEGGGRVQVRLTPGCVLTAERLRRKLRAV